MFRNPPISRLYSPVTIDPSLAKILAQAVRLGASDVHVTPGEPVFFRLHGSLTPEENLRIDRDSARSMAESCLLDNQIAQLATRGSVDGAISLDEHSRFRFNIYQRDSAICMALRLLPENVASLTELGLSPRLYELCDLKDGLILVAGPTGSGKSTTIASMVDRINSSRCSHIITLEDPIEFIHKSQKSLVNQRQIGTDVPSFSQALLDAVRQDPDVILVGELRDSETIRTAISAAETGHLVFASVHAGDCKTAIERLAGAFFAEEQNLAHRLLATVTRSVIVQHLLPRYQSPNQSPESNASPQRVLTSEVMLVNNAIANLIANSNLSQLATVIETSSDAGMWTLDQSLARLWRKRLISESTATNLARNPQLLRQLSKRVS